MRKTNAKGEVHAGRRGGGCSRESEGRRGRNGRKKAEECTYTGCLAAAKRKRHESEADYAWP